MRLSLVIAAALIAGPAVAADAEAGRALAEQCSGCHGEEGVSVSADIPNLAAQKTDYIVKQLQAFRAGDRKNPLMNAIAAQLDDAGIENLAAHFSALPGAAPGAAGTMSAELSGDKPAFQAEYQSQFKLYHTIDFPDRKQVRHYYANQAALDAAAAGAPMPEGAAIFVEARKAKLDGSGEPTRGADGHFEDGDIALFTAMEKQPGWGDAAPEILRNGDWRYAVFTADGAHRSGLNEGPCLACHKPLAKDDYLFTLAELKTFAQSR